MAFALAEKRSSVAIFISFCDIFPYTDHLSTHTIDEMPHRPALPPRPTLETLCAHAGRLHREPDPGNAPFVPSIVQSTIFHLGDSEQAEAIFAGARSGYAYSRFGNPTVEALAVALADLEDGAGALVTSSVSVRPGALWAGLAD